MSGSDPEQPPPTHQPYGQNPYGPPPPHQQQPPYGQPQPGQYAFTPQPPTHPSATPALVLSLVGLVGILVCGGITLVLSPFAWSIGSRAVREIDANPGAYSGRESANAGRIMGIIGTVLLVIGVVGLIVLSVVFIAIVNDPSFESGNS
jgi:hypothetical protein